MCTMYMMFCKIQAWIGYLEYSHTFQQIPFS